MRILRAPDSFHAAAAAVCAIALLFGCGGAVDDRSIPSPRAASPPPAGDDSFGNARFGRWFADADGLPAYEYTMDQTTDPDAVYRVTGGISRDHWHLVGNDRIGATAYNGGYVELYDWSRGGKIVNRWDPARRNFAGGFKFVQTDAGLFNTLWEYRPDGATQRRVFGAGYFAKETQYDGLLVAERIEAPAGDDPVLLSTTRIENRGDRAREVAVVEFWDANLHPLTFAPVMTYGLGDFVQALRSWLVGEFRMDGSFDPATRALRIDFTPRGPAPAPAEASFLDHHPRPLFLAALDPLPPDFSAWAVDQDLFFDERGLADPPGVHGAADARPIVHRSAREGRAVLAMRRVATLAPGEIATWRYIFGSSNREEIPALVHRYEDERPRPQRASIEFAAPGLPWLARELAWHAYYLQAGAYHQDYFGTHLVDQGSAYGYLQGLSGAHRDFALFTLPMVYLRPDLAREMLRFTMRAQDARTGELPYAHVGFGKVTGALIHGASSDLDLFFLWALAEYVAATGDRAFLREPVLFYPPEQGRQGTVLDHARAAFRHLKEDVGLGRHGMLRCGTGDWNDVLVAFSDRPLLTILRGESALNAGLATVSLPALASVVAEDDPAFAAELDEFAQAQREALRPLWREDRVARGYLGHGDAVLGADRIFLDAQGFGVLGGVWSEEQARRLFDRVQADLVAPQGVGALSLFPPMEGPFLEPGSDTNGGTWAAIDAWTAWAWSRVDPAAAWEFFLGTTMAARAEAYPRIWYGVWSGPDSFNAHYHPRAGETFDGPFTPMIDFPVMNMNRHAGPLLAAIKLAGIEPTGDRIVVRPRVPLDSFALRLPLVELAYEPARHHGSYHPVVRGVFRFAVAPPVTLDPGSATLTVNGQPVPLVMDGEGFVVFEVAGSPDDPVFWIIK